MHQFGSFRLSYEALFSTRELLARKRLQTRVQALLLRRPIKYKKSNYDIAHPPGAHRPRAGGRQLFYEAAQISSI